MRFIIGRRLSAVLGMMVCFVSGATATDVQLTGVEGGLKDALMGGSLVVQEVKSSTSPPSPSELLAAAQADYRRLLAVLYDHGYFGASLSIKIDGIEAMGFSSVKPPRMVKRVSVAVNPGTKFRFGQVRITPVAKGGSAPKGFAAGKTASLSILKQAVSDGVEGWREQGYAKAKLKSQQITARHSDHTIGAHLHLSPGPRFRFGPLLVPSNSAVRSQRILDIAGLPTGEFFSPQELKRATARLRRTGAFSAVSLVETDQIGPNNTLAIQAELTDEKPRRLGFGAELATQDGVKLSAYWLHRNLLGGAERLRLDGEVRGIAGDTEGLDYKLSARFDRPATFNEDTHFYAIGTIEKLVEPLYYARKMDLAAGIKRIASPEREYRFGIGLHVGEARDEFGQISYRLLSLPAGLTFDYRDKPLDAQKGYYLNADVTPFAALKGADSGIRAVLDTRYYRSFGVDRPITLALRGQVGALWGPSLATAPADYLFYSGGGGSVRGQSYQTLGVDLAGGETVGGRSFVGLSAEIRVTATEALGIVGFADAGYIGASEFYDGAGRWHSGAGLGVRYKTPIGPIRFDVATPVSGPKSDKKFQVYIGIGQAF